MGWGKDKLDDPWEGMDIPQQPNNDPSKNADSIIGNLLRRIGKKESDTSSAAPDEDPEEQIRRMRRMGITFYNPQVDPKNVLAFAKTARVIGTTAVGIILLWGFFYGDDGGFWEILSDIGFRGLNREIVFWMLPGVIALGGWIYRFHIGVIISSFFLWVAGLIGKFFKSI